MKMMMSFKKQIHGVLLCLSLISPVYSVNLDQFLPDERNSIEIFQKSAPKVVFVHRIARVYNRSYDKIVDVKNGAGSGILWNNQGYIVTNFHVVKDTDKLAVTMGNITVPVKILGVEPRKDIAVLKITSPQALEKLKDFQPFELTRTNELLVGQKVLAIGNPFGLDHSLSTGVISALGRQVSGIGGVKIRDMIQTDAPVNPGNSGGPLLDSAGRLIGMNTMIVSGSGTSAGVGFAVSAEDLERIVQQIIKYGRVILAGIGIQRVEGNIAAQLGVNHGVLIADVLANTPAAKVGLHGTYRNHWGTIILGDIIVGMNGHPVKNYDELYNLFSNMKVGESISLTVIRQGKEMTFKMKTIDIAAY